MPSGREPDVDILDDIKEDFKKLMKFFVPIFLTLWLIASVVVFGGIMLFRWLLS